MSRTKRKTKRIDPMPLLTCVLGALVLLAMIPIVALSWPHEATRTLNTRFSVKADALSLKAEQSTSSHTTRVPPTLAPVRFFPLVQELIVHDFHCCAVLAPDVKIELSSEGKESGILTRVARRAEERLRSLRDEAIHEALGAHSYLWHVRAIHVTTLSSNENLGDGPDSEYWLECEEERELKAGNCRVKSMGVYGAVNALQSTLLQLFNQGGVARFGSLKIHDWPNFKVRGLMIDAGRRFVPLQVLQQHVLEGMALTRMNLLQLHINDFCRFSVDLPGFPELRPDGLMIGQYSALDIQELVAFARDRGIRVVPEIDIPGHADALKPLKARGLSFCESSQGKHNTPNEATKIFDDPEGRSRAVLRQLFKETAAVFASDEPWFHLGADEASPVGSCTSDNIAKLEGFVASDIIGKDLKRIPVAWEELLFKESHTLSRKAVADTKTIIVSWFREKPEEVAMQGHDLIVANNNRHYLDYDFKRHPVANFWYDPSSLQREMPQVRDCRQPTWEEHRGKFLGTYADNGGLRPLDIAKQHCANSGNTCAGVTCAKGPGDTNCDTRKGEPFLQGSALEVSWVKVCPEEASILASGTYAQARQEKVSAMKKHLVGGLSAMWTDRYCHIYSCGAADEEWAKQHGVMPTASVMFYRDLDASFALSFAGMIWPRAGVTASTLWNYQPSLTENALLNHTAWLASVLMKFHVPSCPAHCECDELSACGESYPILTHHNTEDDAEVISFCFLRDSVANNEFGAPLDYMKVHLTTGLRMCFWRGHECGGVICSTSESSATPPCALHAPGRDHRGPATYAKRIECNGAGFISSLKNLPKLQPLGLLAFMS